MKRAWLSVLAKWPLRYLLSVESIYLCYEVSLAINPGQGSPAIIFGVLFPFATQPSSFVLYLLSSYLASWLGFQGDVTGFWGRLLVFQTCIVVNAALVSWLAISSTKTVARGGASR